METKSKYSISLLVVFIFIVGSLITGCGTATPEIIPTEEGQAEGGGGQVQVTESPTQRVSPTQEPQIEEVAEPYTAVIGVASDVINLDPQLEPNTTLPQLESTFENLVWFDTELELQPSLAVSWEAIDEDTWEFKLREGVKFQNGEDFTAEDVEFSYNRVMDLGAESGPRKNIVGFFKSIEVVDDYTVRINTDGPFPAAPRQMALTGFIVPKDYVEEVGAEEFARKPVGTGAYKIVEWKPNESLTLEAFDDYWGGRPDVDRIIFRVIPDEETRIAEMKTGGIDILLDVAPARANELREAGLNVYSVPSVVNFWLAFNTHESPFDNIQVREAIAHAIDVEAIIDSILEGEATRSNTLVHNTSFGWNPNIEPYDYDPDRSMELLREAGFPNGFETTFQAGPGVWPATREAVEAIASFLDVVGIKTELEISEFAEYFRRYRESEIKGLLIWGNQSPSLDPAAHVNLNFVCPEQGGRGIYWCSEETDNLLFEAASELDPAKREQLYWDLQEVFYDEVAAVPLWQFNQISATNDRVEISPRNIPSIYGKDIMVP